MGVKKLNSATSMIGTLYNIGMGTEVPTFPNPFRKTLSLRLSSQCNIKILAHSTRKRRNGAKRSHTHSLHTDSSQPHAYVVRTSFLFPGNLNANSLFSIVSPSRTSLCYILRNGSSSSSSVVKLRFVGGVERQKTRG